MFVRDGIKMTVGQSFEVDGIQYPGNWLPNATSEELAAIGVTVKPDPVFPDSQFFDWVELQDGSLVITQKPKAHVCYIKWEAIKMERDQRKAGGVKVSGKWYHTDADSRIQYGMLDTKAIRAGLAEAVVLHPAWKTMSGEKTPMTVGLLRQIIDAGIFLESSIFNMGESHKEAMQGSPDPASYDFSAGWPLTYSEDV